MNREERRKGNIISRMKGGDIVKNNKIANAPPQLSIEPYGLLQFDPVQRIWQGANCTSPESTSINRSTSSIRDNSSCIWRRRQLTQVSRIQS